MQKTFIKFLSMFSTVKSRYIEVRATAGYALKYLCVDITAVTEAGNCYWEQILGSCNTWQLIYQYSLHCTRNKNIALLS